MTFFFVGQLVRIVWSESAPELVGRETTIIASVIDQWQRECWQIGIPHPESGEGWLCSKEHASKVFAPAIPPEESVQEEDQVVDCVASL